MADILITEFMDEAAVDTLRRDFSVDYDPALVDRPVELAAKAAGARALIVRNRTQVRGALLDAAVRLECVGRLGVGLDNIDLAACKARDIAVFPATGANDVAVAEYVLAGALILVRGAYAASPDVIAGAWPRNRLMGGEVMGRVLGLVGFGAIARQVAKRARAFDMRLIAADPFLAADDPAWAEYGVERVEREALLSSADIISLHVPLTAETRNLIDSAALARMKRGAIVINAARGGVVDEAAAMAALAAGQLGGLMLDVFDTEPLPAGSAFTAHPNLILTPHIAGVTGESNVRVSSVTAESVRRALLAAK